MRVLLADRAKPLLSVVLCHARLRFELVAARSLLTVQGCMLVPALACSHKRKHTGVY